MGKKFTDLTWEDMCDLMCGIPEEEPEEDNKTKAEGGDDNGKQN